MVRMSDSNHRLYVLANGHTHKPVKRPVLERHEGREVTAWVCGECMTPLYESDPAWQEYLDLAAREAE